MHLKKYKYITYTVELNVHHFTRGLPILDHQRVSLVNAAISLSPGVSTVTQLAIWAVEYSKSLAM